MGISVFPLPSAASKTRYVETLTSGTSWTVPAGVTYVNATLVGGSGGGGYSAGISNGGSVGSPGAGGQIITTKVDTTPGNSVAYGIGGAGAAGTGGNGGAGGNTTFTGATTANGGGGGGRSDFGTGAVGTAYGLSGTGGSGGTGVNNTAGAAGGIGCIILEYWL